MTYSTLPRKKLRTKAAMKYLLVLLSVLLVALLQERLLALPSNYEANSQGSLLLDASFILVLPVAWLCHLGFSTAQPLRSIQSLLAQRVIFLLAGALIQILLVATTLWIMSNSYFGQRLEPIEALQYTASEELYKYLLIYSVIAWLLIQKKGLEASSDKRPPKKSLLKNNSSEKGANLIMN